MRNNAKGVAKFIVLSLTSIALFLIFWVVLSAGTTFLRNTLNLKNFHTVNHEIHIDNFSINKCVPNDQTSELICYIYVPNYKQHYRDSTVIFAPFPVIYKEPQACIDLVCWELWVHTKDYRSLFSTLLFISVGMILCIPITWYYRKFKKRLLAIGVMTVVVFWIPWLALQLIT